MYSVQSTLLEAGGQVGDTGTVNAGTGRARITDTRKVAGVFNHKAEVEEGEIRVGDEIFAEAPDGPPAKKQRKISSYF